jgi:predicted DNA-binding antitoxin AbrB/MazE fold protein
MIKHIISATFENGVLKPDFPLPLPSMSRVRLIIEPLATAETRTSPAQESPWSELDRLWNDLEADRSCALGLAPKGPDKSAQGNALGDWVQPPPARDQLHDRH